ncbi:MAG: hypothetical protein LBT97_01780 [Planctomycetota bacterium]|jgi:hypothetical protein|nr:hypothetical protein [Planctomycetota bacterium]
MHSAKIFRFLVSLLFILPAGCLAGEFGAAARAEEPAPVEAAEAVQPDGGAEAVYEAQVAPGTAYAPDQSAAEQLQAFMNDTTTKKEKWVEGWDNKRKRLFVLAYTAFNTEDPRSDRNFLIKREMAAKQAILRAKADVISFVNIEMSAMDQIDVPGTDLYAALNQEYDAVRQRLDRQREIVAKLMERVNDAEAKALAGATFDDRVNALMEAAIRRLDGEFDAGAIEAAQRGRFETAKQRYEESLAEYEELRRKAETMRGEVRNAFSSSVSLQAKMPLTGAVVIQQAESWDEEAEQYQVAVLFCWSAELEKAARAALSGEPPEAGEGRTDGQSFAEWLSSQDLSVMVGPRQFLDNQGRRHFLGVAARPASRDAASDQNNRTIADLFAGQMAVFALFADVDAFSEARQLAETRSSGDLEKMSETVVAETLTVRLTQKFEKMRIQGLAPVRRETARHPLTGQNMHVSVFAVSPDSAATAMLLERQAALSAIAVNQEQAFRNARTQALNAAVGEARTDPAAQRAGALAGRAEIEAARRRAAGDIAGGTASPQTGAASPAATGGKTASGSVMGGDVQDDF